jgi:glycosyltransferase involved in cell wall biosynthesis
METVIILGDLFTFPQYDAPAASNRAYALASGLNENHIKTIIVTFSNIYNKYSGFEKGVEFYIPLEQEERNEYFIIRRYYKFKKYLNTYRYLKLQKRKANLGAIILYTRNPSLILFSFFCTRIFSLKFILEATEFPTKDFGKYSLNKLLFPNILLPLFDGFSCISNPICDYCTKFKSKKAKIVIIPPIFTSKLFENAPAQRGYDIEYIFYSGTLTFYRDGIDVLIRAFHNVNKSFPSLRLILGGKWINESVHEEAVNMVQDLGLSDVIIFSGFVSPEELKSLILNAKILCVPRKESTETTASFPTKLVEYLATGIPVLTTSVGDIPKYLIDGKNGYLAKPNNVDSLTEKLILINTNYKQAILVGKAGKKLAFEEFSNIKCALKIGDLLTELNSQSN